MNATRPYADLIGRLRTAGLRPTRQRLALGKILFAGPDRHITAEGLHRQVAAGTFSVSLATVYNTLHQFTEAGLLREVTLGPGRSFFDTNTTDHHHIYFEEEGRLEDIGADEIEIAALPPAPAGQRITRVELVLRVSPESEDKKSQ